MKTLSVPCSQFNLPRRSILSKPTSSKLRIASSARITEDNHLSKVSIFFKNTLFSTTAIEKPPREEVSETETPKDNGSSRALVLGAVSLGVLALVMGFDGRHEALALGPEGPLMEEEFWDNVRRYALYALTVSTGAIYSIVEPILELLKNPISAILVLLVLGGGLFIVSQVLSAMVGVTEFSYEYGY